MSDCIVVPKANPQDVEELGSIPEQTLPFFVRLRFFVLLLY
jgi:hypothetical protein